MSNIVLYSVQATNHKVYSSFRNEPSAARINMIKDEDSLSKLVCVIKWIESRMTDTRYHIIKHFILVCY